MLVALFYTTYTLILIIATLYLLIFFRAIYNFRPKSQIPSVYIYIMIAFNFGSIFIELTTDTIPILLTRKQNKWVYIHIGEYLTLLDSFVYPYPMLLTAVMTCQRIYVTFFPTGRAFSNTLIWLYSLLLAITLLILILIPFFSECTVNFDFYTFEYTNACDDEDHILVYIVDTYTPLVPVISMLLNVLLIVHLFFKRRAFSRSNQSWLSSRRSHEKTLMIQCLSTTTFLLIYEIIDFLTDALLTLSAFPPLARRAIFYSQTSCVMFTCFFVYFVGTPSIRRIIIREYCGLVSRRGKITTVMITTGRS